MRLALIGLLSVIGILAGSWVFVLLTIAWDGSYLLREPNPIILRAELAVSLWLLLLAVLGIVFLISKGKEVS